MIWFSSLTQKMVNEQVDYIKLRSGSQLFYKAASAVIIALFIFVSVKLFHAKVEQLLLIFVIFSRLWPRFTAIQSNMEHIAASIPAFQALKKYIPNAPVQRSFIMRKMRIPQGSSL